MNHVLSAPRAEAAPAPLSSELLRRFDTPGPRYTSYPTADRFHTGFGAEQANAALLGLGQALDGGASAPLSAYVHIPFCESLCYYCACNKVITKHHERSGPYLDALQRELELVCEPLGRGRRCTQVHLGGGSPTFLSDDELRRVVDMLRDAFDLSTDAEMSIEVDPRTVTAERLANLRGMGFNRISFGVQDFDAQVQRAVHRVQPYDSVRLLMDSARSLGFQSINADLIYGLPRQTPESFARTVAQIGALRPQRIALYAYAHLPQRFKPQRRIDDGDLPSAAQRVAMLGGALAGFAERGYRYIGMDHFALPEDALAVAKAEGRLHRNFQGYSTQPDCDLVALGVSAIGRVGATYSQNAKSLPEYFEALRDGRLPVQRGIALSADDLLRRDIIMALMCQGRVSFDDIEATHGIDMEQHFTAELRALQPMVESDLVQMSPRSVDVTARGWYLVRAVAMIFDRYLANADGERRFSRVL